MAPVAGTVRKSSSGAARSGGVKRPLLTAPAIRAKQNRAARRNARAAAEAQANAAIAGLLRNADRLIARLFEGVSQGAGNDTETFNRTMDTAGEALAGLLGSRLTPLTGRSPRDNAAALASPVAKTCATCKRKNAKRVAKAVIAESEGDKALQRESTAVADAALDDKTHIAALQELERRFLSGRGAAGAIANKRILDVISRDYAAPEAFRRALRWEVRNAYPRSPAVRDKIFAMARAASTATNLNERKRLFLEAATGISIADARQAVEEREADAARKRHQGLGDVEHEADREQRRANRAAADNAFKDWQRANPHTDIPGRITAAARIAKQTGAAPAALRNLMLRLRLDRRMPRDVHGRMVITNPDFALRTYQALAAFWRADPKLARKVFSPLARHMALAQIAFEQDRGPLDKGAGDIAKRERVTRIYWRAGRHTLDEALRKHGSGFVELLEWLPGTGNLIAAIDTATDLGAASLNALGVVGGPLGRGVKATAKSAIESAATATDVAKRSRTTLKNKANVNVPPPRDHDLTREGFKRELELSPEWRKHRRANPNRPIDGRDFLGDDVEIGPLKLPAKIGDTRLAARDGKYGAIDREGMFVQGSKPSPNKWAKGKPPKRTADGGTIYTLNVRGNNTEVYYNKYGFPEFEPKAVVWLPAEKIRAGSKAHNAYVLDYLRRLEPADLQKIGISSLRIKQLKKGSGITLKTLGLAVASRL